MRLPKRTIGWSIFKKVEAHINELNLFTFEELQESANLLKKDLVD